MRCPTPESVPLKGGNGKDRVSVPCGRCATCLTNRREEWIIRLTEEAKDHKYAIFITLTYNEKNNPGQLDKRHVQNYIKKLRKAFKCRSIRYYAIGEYGPNTFRPHYHIIMFGLSMDDHSIVTNLWDYGFTTIGDVQIRRISYIAKYHVNKTKFPDGKSPPFALMSKGIGKGYLFRMSKNHKGNIDKANYQMFEWKKRLPRYYTEKLYTKIERQKIAAINLSDFFEPQKIKDWNTKNPGQSYFKYIQQKIENHERKYREKTAYNNKL